jgi:ribonuclease HI
MDSELVQKQLSGIYQIKEPSLVPQFIEIHNLRVSAFPHIQFVHVRREENARADALANEAMDRRV